MLKTHLLICDLDNTLYDWIGYFVPAFYAMVDKAVEITGCDREQLLDDLRTVHQRYHDSEHPFALLEAQTIQRHFSSREEAFRALDAAFHAFNSVRKKTLTTYPGVVETLQALMDADVMLIAHTESKLHGVVDRMRRLELTHFFTRIYCRERHEIVHPGKSTGNWLQDFPMDRVQELSQHQWKPNPDVLREICARENIAPQQVAYIGDSISKDILMAKQTEVFAIWASYGAHHDAETYGKLVRVSHWTAEEVAREMRLKEEAKSVTPDYIARTSFVEVLSALGL